MAIKPLKNVADIPSEELDDWGPVPQPVSDEVSQKPATPCISTMIVKGHGKCWKLFENPIRHSNEINFPTTV